MIGPLFIKFKAVRHCASRNPAGTTSSGNACGGAAGAGAGAASGPARRAARRRGVVNVWLRQRTRARMRAAIDEGRQIVAEHGGNIVDSELGVVVHHQHVGNPGAGPQAHVANYRHGVRHSRRRGRRDGMHVPDLNSRSTWFCIMSKPAAVVGGPSIQSTKSTNHPTAPRRQRHGMEEPARAAVLRLGALTRLARTYSVTSTSWPTQEARRCTSDPVLARPKCPPSGPSWHCGAPGRAARRRWGCRAGPPHLGRGDRGGRNVPETSHRWACWCDQRGALCASRRAYTRPPPHRA